jgi:hypothetical protein
MSRRLKVEHKVSRSVDKDIRRATASGYWARTPAGMEEVQ